MFISQSNQQDDLIKVNSQMKPSPSSLSAQDIEVIKEIKEIRGIKEIGEIKETKEMKKIGKIKEMKNIGEIKKIENIKKVGKNNEIKVMMEIHIYMYQKFYQNLSCIST